jgi:hypothetical protein
MMRRFGVGAATGLAVAFAAVAALAAPAGAQRSRPQSPPSPTTRLASDTAMTDTTASDTTLQSPGMQEFQTRRRDGGGYYLTARQLARQQDRSFGDILTTNFPGLSLAYGANLVTEYVVSTRGQGPNALVANGVNPLCYLQVFVNGAFIVDGDISWIRASDVDGVEMYDYTRTPPAYRRPNGVCGVLLVWLKAGG